jgi:hypothetical protein
MPVGVIVEISVIMTVCAVIGVTIWFTCLRTPKDDDCDDPPTPLLTEEELNEIEIEAKQVTRSAQVIVGRVAKLRQTSDIRQRALTGKDNE